MTPAGGAADPNRANAAAEQAGNPLDVLRDDVRERFQRASDAASAPPAQSRQAVRGLIAPLPVPRVVITLLAETAQGITAAAGAISAEIPAHLARFPVQLELRLDALRDHAQRAHAAAFVHRIGIPYVLTLRAAREGGHATLTDAERQWLLAQLFAAMPRPAPPGSLLDLEAASLATDPTGWTGAIVAAREKGFHVLLSHHDPSGTPSDPHALLPPARLLDDCPGGTAVLYKSATATRTWEEELAVLAALAAGNRRERAAAIMGMGRPTARLLAPFFRAPLVYASVDAARAAAPGQVPFGDLLAAWWRWGVRPTDTGLSDENNPARLRPSDAEPPLPPRLALLGRPALHSLSPAIHNAAAAHLRLPHRYLPLEPPSAPADPDESLAATRPWLARLGIVGGNATAPYKTALAHAADRPDAPVQALDAANTFRLDGDTLHATNTDPEGIRAPLAAAGMDIARARVLVLGAGGAARAALYALRDAERLSVTNRTPERAEATRTRLQNAGVETHAVAWPERARAAAEATLIVQATPLGLAGTAHAAASALPPDALRPGVAAFELVYEPLETPFLAAARAAGAKPIDGLQMLLAQAAASFTYWTGKEAPRDVMRDAARDAARTPLPASVRGRSEEAA